MTDPDTHGLADDAGLPLAVHRHDADQPERRKQPRPWHCNQGRGPQSGDRPDSRLDPVAVGFWAVYAVALVAFVAVIASVGT